MPRKQSSMPAAAGLAACAPQRRRIFAVASAALCLALALALPAAAAPRPAPRRAPAAAPGSSATPRKVIIDTDPGTDDAIALLLAFHSPELALQAITVVAGNVTVERGLENGLKLASLAGRCDVPVARGAAHPLLQPLVTAEFWHGENGLGNVRLPASRCHADVRFAADLIIQMIHAQPHQITLVTLGPLTNIALAVLQDPSIVPLVARVIVMGGSLSGGNVTAAAEANIHGDPEAAKIVFGAGWPLTMVGLDVAGLTIFTRTRLEALRRGHGPEAGAAASILEFMIAISEKYGASGAAMYDPLAVGVAIDGSLVREEPMRVEIETRGEFTRGETVANRRDEVETSSLRGGRYRMDGLSQVAPNASVCTGVDAGKFLSLLVSRLAGN